MPKQPQRAAESVDKPVKKPRKQGAGSVATQFKPGHKPHPGANSNGFKPGCKKHPDSGCALGSKRGHDKGTFKPGQAMPAGAKPFQKGQVANPLGRAAGTRDTLTKSFIKRLAADFEAHGAGVIPTVRIKKPEIYLQLVAKLMPQRVEVGEPGDFSESTDDDLTRIAALAAQRLRATRDQYCGSDAVN